MAHFAEVDESNVVLRVLVVSDEQEHRGQEYLADDLGLGGTWLRSSFNTRNNVHYDFNGEFGSSPDGGVAFRGNAASVGFIYDPVLDVFRRPQPFPSWVFDVPTAGWQSPVPYPGVIPPDPDEPGYDWDEDTTAWIEIPEP